MPLQTVHTGEIMSSKESDSFESIELSDLSAIAGGQDRASNAGTGAGIGALVGSPAGPVGAAVGAGVGAVVGWFWPF